MPGCCAGAGTIRLLIIPAGLMIALFLAYVLPVSYRASTTVMQEGSSLPSKLVPTTVTGSPDVVVNATEQLELARRRVMTKESLIEIVKHVDPIRPDGSQRGSEGESHRAETRSLNGSIPSRSSRAKPHGFHPQLLQLRSPDRSLSGRSAAAALSDEQPADAGGAGSGGAALSRSAGHSTRREHARNGAASRSSSRASTAALCPTQRGAISSEQIVRNAISNLSRARFVLPKSGSRCSSCK